MEREFSAPLHHTQYGNHLEYRNNGGHRKMNPEVQKLMDAGMSERSAYRHVSATKPKKKEPDFNYDRETPKGEWV